MATQITNNGASLKITSGAQIRDIMKSQVIEISVVKTNIIKIDIGKGALYNVFIPFADVTEPVAADPETLKEAINAMIASSPAGTATEARQVEQTVKLNTIDANINNIKNSVGSLDGKIFFEPVIVDESNPQTIYKGFASPAANPADAVWAIQKISTNGDVVSYQWADGNKNFDNVWNDRVTLAYS